MHRNPSILCYEMEVVSLFNMLLVSGCEKKLFRLYFSWTRRRLLLLQNFVIYFIQYQKWFLCYHFPSSFQIFIKCIWFSVRKADWILRKFVKKYPLLLYQKMLMSAFLLRFKANYLEKIHGYPHFSLWIPIALANF